MKEKKWGIYSRNILDSNLDNKLDNNLDNKLHNNLDNKIWYFAPRLLKNMQQTINISP